ncbi:MAG TPA: hypothetical protein PK264_09610 [Hyphomicrobiaceae bacterium]|nr:hypothetical protein [Hyphomicrobiaceae bacterium]
MRLYLGLAAAAALLGISSASAAEPPAKAGLEAIAVEANGAKGVVRYKHFPVAGKREAIIYLHGDLPPKAANGDSTDEDLRILQSIERRLRSFSADRLVPTVMIARPGYLWSSGDPEERHSKTHNKWIRDAIEGVVTRLGIERYALVGQSGGSTAIALTLPIGERQSPCVVLGSGSFSWIKTARHQSRMFNMRPITRAIERQIESRDPAPIGTVTEIPVVEGRRIIVLGDPRDWRTPFAAQVEYWAAMRDRGHEAIFMVKEAFDKERHGMSGEAMTAGERCLNETRPDEAPAAVTPAPANHASGARPHA